jgi:hypothetical protein
MSCLICGSEAHLDGSKGIKGAQREQQGRELPRNHDGCDRDNWDGQWRMRCDDRGISNVSYGAGTHTDVRAQLPSLGKHLRTFTCRGKCKRATAQSSATREPAQSAACAPACPHAPDVDTARPRRTRKTPRLLAAILIAGTCIKATVCCSLNLSELYTAPLEALSSRHCAGLAATCIPHCCTD